MLVFALQQQYTNILFVAYIWIILHFILTSLKFLSLSRFLSIFSTKLFGSGMYDTVYIAICCFLYCRKYWRRKCNHT